MALFSELSSAPASMAAAKACDAYGLLPGFSCEASDAEQAYIQAKLNSDVPTWVTLPPHQWPAHWHGQLRQPIVPQRLALYGRPDSGGHWERHCDERLRKAGFRPVADWRSCYVHPAWHLLLVVYVDDFKMASPLGPLPQVGP